MLQSGKLAIFIVFSVIIHILFVIFFSHVTLSFTPPTAKKLSLALMTRGGRQSDIVQTQPVWVEPKRVEPDFPVKKVLSEMESEATDMRQIDQPESSVLTQQETLIPPPDIQEYAEKFRPRPSKDFFAPLPAETKPMPTAEFTLGPDFPELFDEN